MHLHLNPPRVNQTVLIPPIIPFPWFSPNFLFTPVQLGIVKLRAGKLEIQCEEAGWATQRGEPFRWGHEKKAQIHQRSAIPEDNEQDDMHSSVSHQVFSFLFLLAFLFFPNQNIFELLLFGAH